MSKESDTLISYLRTLAGGWRDDSRDDAELLSRFAETGDEAAFKVLAWRHGLLVWQTCRRILGNTSDTEDAFQTVFLTMARKARQITIKNPASWLHRVARRAALNVAAGEQRRRKLEQRMQTVAKPASEGNVAQTELYSAMDEELASLPERLRVPLLLHYIEGKSQIEVARILGCARSVLQKRLTKGETILRQRMERRGLALGIGAVAALLGEKTEGATMPAGLIGNTVQAAVAFRAGSLAGASAELAEKMLHVLAVEGTVRKLWWVVVACVGFLGSAGVGLIAWKMYMSGSDAVESAVAKPALNGTVTKQRGERVDCYGDPVPDGAIARIGTSRFRGPGEPYYDEHWPRDGIALSRDGKTLASAHFASSRKRGDGVTRVAIRFWDTATGRQLHETVLDNDLFAHIAFSPDCKLLAVSVREGVRLLDAATGQPLGEPLPGRCGPLVFTADNKILINQAESFTLYDVGTRKPVRVLRIGQIGGPGSGLSSVAISRDGRFFACVEETIPTETVHVFDFKTGTRQTTLKGRQVSVLVFTPDGNKLITAGKDKVIRVWDTMSGKELRQLGTMRDVPSLVEKLEMPPLVDLLADGKTVLAASAGQIRCWDVTTGQETRPALDCKGLICPRVLSADGKKLIERVRGALRIWDVTTGKEIDPATGAPHSHMNVLTFSPDGKILATTKNYGDTEIQLWDVATGKNLGSLAAPGPRVFYSEMAWPSRNMLLTRVTAVLEGRGEEIVQLATAAGEGATDKTQTYPDGVALSSHGQVLARQGGHGLDLFETATGKKLATVSCYVSDLTQLFMHRPVAFSADLQILATHRTDEPTITLWDVPSGRKLDSFNIPIYLDDQGNPIKPKELETAIYDQLIGLSPDGRLVVTQDERTKAVSLWEHVSGHLRLRLPMPSDYNDLADNNVALSPDGRLLAAGCVTGSNEERSVLIWDLATGKEYQRFQGHKPGASFVGAPRVVFSPDGRRLASAGMDYTVLIWDVKQPPALEVLSQPLDPEEMQSLKTALVGVDAAEAFRAIVKLQQVPEQAVPLAAECLCPRESSPVPEEVLQKVNHLIADLDSDNFQTRTMAAKELGKCLSAEKGEPVVQTVLYQALTKKTSLEASTAIRHLLDGVKEERKLESISSAELTRMLRVIEVLERINNAPARELLHKMIDTPPRLEVRRDAEAALKRLAALQAGRISSRPQDFK